MQNACSIAIGATMLGSALLGLALPARAESPSGPAAGIGLDFQYDALTAPDGTRFRIAGVSTAWQLSWRGAPAAPEAWLSGGRWGLHYGGAFAPLNRMDTDERFSRLNTRLLADWRQPLAQRPFYSVAGGLGLLLDGQAHLGAGAGAASGQRSRDYLDENQWRGGPVVELDIAWRHPAVPNWETRLDAKIGPYMWGMSTGNVAFPATWLYGEAAVGPAWQSGPAALSLQLEARGWLAGLVASQWIPGVRLNGAYAF